MLDLQNVVSLKRGVLAEPILEFLRAIIFKLLLQLLNGIYMCMLVYIPWLIGIYIAEGSLISYMWLDFRG